MGITERHDANEPKAEQALLKANRGDMGGLAKELAGMSPKELTDCAGRLHRLSTYQEKHNHHLPVVEIKFDDNNQFAGATVTKDGQSIDYDAQGRKTATMPGAENPKDQASSKTGADNNKDATSGKPGADNNKDATSGKPGADNNKDATSGKPGADNNKDATSGKPGADRSDSATPAGGLKFQETVLPGGTRRFQLDDGSTLDVKSDESRTLWKRDGTKIVSEKDGSLSTYHPNGSSEQFLPHVRDGKPELDKDGNPIFTVNRVDSDGNTTIEDPNGKRTYIPGAKDKQLMTKACEQLHDACGPSSSSHDTISKALSDQTPERRECMDKMFKEKYGTDIDTYLKSEQQKQEQALLDKLDEHGKHWYPGGGTDRAKMVQDIENMTPHQQFLYRTDKDFQKKVDEKVKGDMVSHVSISKHDEDALHAAQHFLDKVKNSQGETQQPDLTSKLLKHAAGQRWSFEGEEKRQRQEALADLTEAEKSDPTLRDRIANGTDTDSVELRSAAKQALGDEEYKKYIQGSKQK